MKPVLYRTFHAPTWMAVLDQEQVEKLGRGEALTFGSGVYAVCGDCRCVVRLNKCLFGALHFCESKRADKDGE